MRVFKYQRGNIIISNIGNLWSIRMRASKKAKCQRPNVKCRNAKSRTQDSKTSEIHISGAEGIYEESEIQRITKKYILRALNHSKGKPDRIIITIEDIKEKPKSLLALPVTTVKCKTPEEGKNIVTALLQSSGISKLAINRAFQLIKRGNMRGAALVTAEKGKRLEPDGKRGVRASRLGIDKGASKILSLRLSRRGINRDIVKEALILASKVVSCEPVLAELCVSDDPYYTTGYVASGRFGYLRIPNIKEGGSKMGGRAFFIREGIDVDKVIDYLERTAIIIRKVSSCNGIMSLHEILNHPHQ
ncbi:MAG: 6-carboxyhexanoate--CoA ligase [Nitrospirota bacterium]